MLCAASKMHYIWALICFLGFLPAVTALGKDQPFPDIPFIEFSQFILKTFNSDISLSTVLFLLFTLTENTELLNLHARQRSSAVKPRIKTSWIKALAKAVNIRARVDKVVLLKEKSMDLVDEKDKAKDLIRQIDLLSLHLDAFASKLDLLPVTRDNKFAKALKPVSHTAIEAVYTVCPQSNACQTRNCALRSIQQVTRKKDLPLVTLIKDFKFHTNVPVLSGHCSQCNTFYYSDHERFPDSADRSP